MPVEIKDVKLFMAKMIQNKELTEGKSLEKKVNDKSYKKTLTVKQSKGVTKLKLRTKSYLFTYKTDKSDVVKKILSNLPSNVTKIDVKKNSKKIRK